MMEDELQELLADLKEAEESEDECLPNYGYERKAEVIGMLKAEIERIRGLMPPAPGYTDDELEQERRDLCLSLGIARYC